MYEAHGSETCCQYAYRIKVLQQLEKITTGLETGVPLMHKFVYPSTKNSLSCCLNHCTTASCAPSSIVNIQPYKGFLLTVQRCGNCMVIIPNCMEVVGALP
jgi:hypothetical protein